MRNRLILWAALLAGGFLLGFVPRFLEGRRLELELSQATADLSTCRFDRRLSNLRDLAARIYLEASRRNYGLASEHSSRFFDDLGETAGQTTDPALRQRLQELLLLRDSTTSGLAKADAGILADLQTLLVKTQDATRTGAP